jgi:hypothetical protein
MANPLTRCVERCECALLLQLCCVIRWRCCAGWLDGPPVPLWVGERLVQEGAQPRRLILVKQLVCTRRLVKSSREDSRAEGGGKLSEGLLGRPILLGV